MSAKQAYIMKRPKRPQFNVRPNIKFKNRLNSEIVMGDLINEEEIEGKHYFVVRTQKGNVVKLTKEAYSILK